ncbi:hypothetical protein BS329_20955 [Amycolatopsis coloradensis]|uniref:Uncharacterized protein n=1 Tax=Amycolatopsis coloradensis TaxID=76021 RepID=A0A1R0KR05_9PSEU|nr:hypothetical protein [Amycolatopsis coloradensis]OLZ50091.1 hypothetical protein BS329_20955 [Amycolatopsis coloradensis]
MRAHEELKDPSVEPDRLRRAMEFVDNTTWPAFPIRRGIDLGDKVWPSPSRHCHDGATVTFHAHRIYRGGAEVGGVDYQACHACRTALLGELELTHTDARRRGMGTRSWTGFRGYLVPEAGSYL